MSDQFQMMGLLISQLTLILSLHQFLTTRYNKTQKIWISLLRSTQTVVSLQNQRKKNDIIHLNYFNNFLQRKTYFIFRISSNKFGQIQVKLNLFSLRSIFICLQAFKHGFLILSKYLKSFFQTLTLISKYNLKLMSLILKKYIKKRKLGRGAFGDVILAQDQNGNQVAIKMVSRKMIQKQPYMEDYLEGQKEVMMSIKSPHVVELYSYEEDQNFKYFICEYCDGGDLLNFQAKQPQKVFSLNYAIQILSEVIQGFEILHERGYLHRDIKPANILLKKTSSQNKFQFKLADFGFTKKRAEVSGTVVGTESYMSPEVFSNETYGYEVDMWAFGVLFYLMLNMELPFKFNVWDSNQAKREKLIKQANNFSYADYVSNSKKKIVDNCIPEVQDLFKKMFNPNPSQRISFIQIRQHPLFKKCFPLIDQKSMMIYQNKHIKKNIPAHKKNETKQISSNDKSKSMYIQENAIPGIDINKTNTTAQKARLEADLEKINFLSQVSKELPFQLDFINPEHVAVLCYNLLKYYIILLRKFLYKDLTLQELQVKYPKLQWRKYMKTEDFTSFKTSVSQLLSEAQMNFSLFYDQCKNIIQKIKNENPEFESNLDSQVKDNQFGGNFKKSYRTSTGFIYEGVRLKFSNGNKYSYLTAIIVMCHGFNHLIACNDESLEKLFPQFMQERDKKGKNIEFIEIKNWMSRTTKQKIKVVIKNIIVNFFNDQ